MSGDAEFRARPSPPGTASRAGGSELVSVAEHILIWAPPNCPLFGPRLLSFLQDFFHLIDIEQLALLRRVKPISEFSCDFFPIGRKPGLLRMEHCHSSFEVFIHAFIRPTLHILTNYLFQIRSKLDRHAAILAVHPH
jgi:hypothetical protein